MCDDDHPARYFCCRMSWYILLIQVFCSILGMTSASQIEQIWLKSRVGGSGDHVREVQSRISPLSHHGDLDNSGVDALVKSLAGDLGDIVASCATCGKSFRSTRGFDLHMKMHSSLLGTGTCPQCSVCGKHLQTKAHLRRHMKSHSSDKPYVCSFCNRAYKHRKDLGVHQKHAHHPQ